MIHGLPAEFRAYDPYFNASFGRHLIRKETPTHKTHSHADSKISKFKLFKVDMPLFPTSIEAFVNAGVVCPHSVLVPVKYELKEWMRNPKPSGLHERSGSREPSRIIRSEGQLPLNQNIVSIVLVSEFWRVAVTTNWD